MKRSARLFLLYAGWAGAAAAAGSLPAPGQRLDLQVTSEISTGGEAEPSGIPVRQSTLSLRYRAEGWSAQADVPWLRVAGLSERAQPPVRGSRAADEGLGNVRLKLLVPLRAASPARTGMDLVLRLQGADRALVGGVFGGDAGQSVRLALQRPIADWKLFGHVGWRRGGNLPGSDPGRAAWQGELGVSRLLAPRLEAGAVADLRQAVRGNPMLPEATLYAEFKDRDRKWGVFVTRAFAPAFPDLAVGLNYRASF